MSSACKKCADVAGDVSEASIGKEGRGRRKGGGSCKLRRQLKEIRRVEGSGRRFVI